MSNPTTDDRPVNHSHPMLRPGLPPKKVSARLIVPVEEPSTSIPVRKERVGCCG
jgi:hypothetical protein